MNEYLNWLSGRISELEQEGKALAADGRRDESAFVQIRCNIFGVAKTIYEVMERTCAPGSVDRVYLEKLDRLPEGWKESLELARTHGEIRKAFIEEQKLETLAEIRRKFGEVRHG